MLQSPYITAVLVAGGTGSRFSNQQDKLLIHVNGQPVLYHSVRALLAVSAIQALVVVCRADCRQHYAQVIAQAVQHAACTAAFTVQWALAGETRRQSVWNGLQQAAVDTKWILIHDAARPLVKPDTIRKMLEQFNGLGGLALAQPVVDTIKQKNAAGQLITLTREHLWAIQTPQVFNYASLLYAHQQVPINQPVTDDCQLLELSGVEPVNVYASTDANPKITTPEDVVWLNYLSEK